MTNTIGFATLHRVPVFIFSELCGLSEGLYLLAYGLEGALLLDFGLMYL
jgi:hypothetical protein